MVKYHTSGRNQPVITGSSECCQHSDTGQVIDKARIWCYVLPRALELEKKKTNWRRSSVFGDLSVPSCFYVYTCVYIYKLYLYIYTYTYCVYIYIYIYILCMYIYIYMHMCNVQKRMDMIYIYIYTYSLWVSAWQLIG